MSKTKLIWIVASFFLVLNLFMLGFILWNRPNHRKPLDPRAIVIKKLKFSETQISSYDSMIQTHRNSINNQDDTIRQLKNQLYSSLVVAMPSVKQDSLIEQIGARQVKIEHIHYKHFEEIRNLCTPMQMKDFEFLSLEIASIFSKPKPQKNNK